MKCKHFDLLHRLFITDSKPNKNWSRLTLGVKSKDRWKNIKEYIKGIVESHQYGEFLYLLQHNWCMPTCRHCGKPLKYNHGYKTYCSIKCARPYQNTSQATSKTWHKNRDAADSQISINKDDLSLYDKEYISLLVKDNALTKYFITVKTSKDSVYANIRYWLSHRILWTNKWSETIYCVYHNITEQPCCEICKKPVKYISFEKGYREYCSKLCNENILHKKECRKIVHYHKYNHIPWTSNISIKRYDNMIYKACTNNAHRNGYSAAFWKHVNTDQNKNRKKNIIAYIQNRFKDITYGLTEVLYRIKNNIEECPTCKTCGKPVKYDNRRKTYKEYCCRSCMFHDKDVQKSIHKRALAKHGSINNQLQISKSIQRHFNIRTEEKRQKDNKAISNGMLQHREMIGIDNWNAEYHRRNETKRRNGTFNTSTPEDELAKYILIKFPDMKRQYRTKEYPFACDYYIPSINVYIELQGSWTHGGKSYENTSEDNALVQTWRDKHTKYYDNAIETWTVRDVKKRNIAKKNNLRYIELFPVKGKPDLTHYKQVIDKIYEEFTRKS
jgi:hypothetical protein